MIIKNRLDKPFGPIGGSTGFFLFLGGIAATWFSLYGLILVAIGAFIAFTTTTTLIDTDKKKIRFSNDLFGIIRTGKWIDIKPDMKLGLRRIHRGYMAYSRGNQSLSIHNSDIRIILYEADDDEIMHVKRFTNRESAVNDINFLSAVLGINCVDHITL